MVFSRATAAAVLGMIATASAEAVQFSIDMCNTAPTTVGVRLNSPGDGNWWEREPIAAVKNDNDNVWTLTSPADTPAGTQVSLSFFWITISLHIPFALNIHALAFFFGWWWIRLDVDEDGC